MQNSSTLRRLASDHSSLHTSDLPPNYLFSPADLTSSLPDDLTQLTILLTGPQGTPYSQGLWKLRLKIPEDYPKSPPKAAFRTRIWHPNVEEKTGHVCVDTLKKDWEPTLTLRDVLITLSCLLIHPNPDSALNATAGHMLQDNYDQFARQARLMTSIHAQIPSDMKEAVLEAKRRGEAAGTEIKEDTVARPKINGKSADSSLVVMKKLPSHLASVQATSTRRLQSAPTGQAASGDSNDVTGTDEDNEMSASKENDPSLSPSPVTTPIIPRRPHLAKRPLSDLPTPVEPDFDCNDAAGLSLSERNIANNARHLPTPSPASAPTPAFADPMRKPSSLAERSPSVNFNSRGLQDNGAEGLAIVPFEDKPSSDDGAPAAKRVCSGEGKENVSEGTSDVKAAPLMMVRAAGTSLGTVKAAAGNARKVPVGGSVGAGSAKGRPRVGLRRL